MIKAMKYSLYIKERDMNIEIILFRESEYGVFL